MQGKIQIFCFLSLEFILGYSYFFELYVFIFYFIGIKIFLRNLVGFKEFQEFGGYCGLEGFGEEVKYDLV